MSIINRLPSSNSSSNSSGASANINLYVQINEPEIKEGVWLQTDYVYKQIIIDSSIASNQGTWLDNTSSNIAKIPFNFVLGTATVVGTDIYIFGGNVSYYAAYKYDTIKKSYTQLASMPYAFIGGSAISVGNFIYIFGSSYTSSKYFVYSQTAYKYDIKK